MSTCRKRIRVVVREHGGAMRADQLLARQCRERRRIGAELASIARSQNSPPTTEAHSSNVRSAGRAGRGEPRAAPGSSAGRRTSPSVPSSLSIASICSTKSGLPSAAARDALAHVRRRGRRRPSSSIDQLSASSSESGSSRQRRRVVLAAAPARPCVEQVGPREAEEEDRASRLRSAMCSTRSRNVGSAQWMSSSTSDERPVAASASKSLRTARLVSSGRTVPSASPIPAKTSFTIRCASGSASTSRSTASASPRPRRISTSGQ